MKKKYFFTLALLSCILLNANAQWVSINKNKTGKTPPQVTILSDDNQSTVVRIDVSGFEIKEFYADKRAYQAIDLLTDVFTTTPGLPELPYVANILAIPDQAGVSVELLETSKVQTFENIHIQPARASWFEGQPEPPYTKNKEAYGASNTYPNSSVEIEPPSVFRDFQISRFSAFPIRYIASKNEIQVVSSMTIRINYTAGKAANPKKAVQKAIAPSFAKLYRSSILNYQNVLDNVYSGEENGRDVMLCIMPDEFTESFQIYADWKRQSGTDVHVTKFSDIGANSSNPDIIKDHISDAYYNWEYPPTYVLIVGDNNVFPKKTVTYPDYSFANEDYFVEIDGEDFFPEMMIGRFTNQGDYRMQVMINKFLKYEKEPYVADTEWFKKAVCCANNDYETQVETKRFTADLMLNAGGFTSVDTLMSDGDGWGGGGCTMDLSDVTNAINEGRSWLNYRGEGWSDGWSANCYNFSTSDVSSLNNGEKFTFVTSIGCGVAMFDTWGGNCFGEEWVQLGSLTSPRGGVAFVGPTSNTHTAYNNRIDRGIYTGMFLEGMDTPGQALLRGKLYMYNVFGADYYCEYHYKIFCVLGDPSIHIWKDVPQNIVVNHPSSTPIGYSQPQFTLTYASSGQPVPNAQVCISGEDIFANGYTDSTGVVYIGITPESVETLTVTVRGGTVIPYQGTINVTASEEHVGPEFYPVINDLDGNNDGLINPNETCSITFTLKNWGSQTATNVEGVLVSIDPNVEVISQEPVSFGNIGPGSSNTGDPIQFKVKATCPIEGIITLKLQVSSDANTWEYLYNEEIMGCKLRYRDYVIDDDGAAEKNYRLDPGETVKVFLSIVNKGEDGAVSVKGILRSDDPHITIIDSVGQFGTIGIQQDALNIVDYFVVSADLDCPDEYLAAFSIKLNTQNGNYPYETIRELEIPVAMPMPEDYTGPDEYGYYAYSNEDTLYEQAPDYQWFEIKYSGTRIQASSSEYTTTVNLPFAFQYYGIDYDELRISTDGWAAFGGGNQTTYQNGPLPKNDNVNNMLAVFWDDLYLDWGEEGEIYYYNDAFNHRFIVEWDSIAINEQSYSPKTEVFQLILLDPEYYPTATGDGEIIFQYKYLSKISSNTIGIENNTNDIGLTYVYNKNYVPTASILRNGDAIKFTTEGPLVTVGVDENHESKSKGLLQQNFPNPFHSLTQINYTLTEESRVILEIYNMNGEIVQTLQNGKQYAGDYSVSWDGRNNEGIKVRSGIYLYSLKTKGSIETRKLFIY